MLVIRKKQIVIATMFTFLSIFTFMFTTASKETKEDIKETVSIPSSRKSNSVRCRAWSSR